MLLALCGLVMLGLVREETGTEAFLVGLGLAVLPAPAVVLAFRWLGRAHPLPWGTHAFVLAWGACAGALIALVANSFVAVWLADAWAHPVDPNTLAAFAVAPVVEESAKATALLLVLVFRGRLIRGPVDAVVLTGLTATGFAFTENILYLAKAFGSDRDEGTGAAITVATFFIRAVFSPFAHPLFTCMTGLGVGLALLSRRRVGRVLLPVAGLLLAMGMHAAWNGSTVLGPLGFPLVYVTIMIPALGFTVWLVLWHRQRELRTVRETLPRYALAGWLSPYEPLALGSLRSRRIAAEFASYHGIRADARRLRLYAAAATRLALLRSDAERGRRTPDFAHRERALLDHLWRDRALARPAFAHSWRLAPPRAPHLLPAQPADAAAPGGWYAPPAWWPPAPPRGYGQGPGYGHGHGAPPPPGRAHAPYGYGGGTAPYGGSPAPYGYGGRPAPYGYGGRPAPYGYGGPAPYAPGQPPYAAAPAGIPAGTGRQPTGEDARHDPWAPPRE
ncbi:MULTISPECIES: PrsW family glutamic-type intramembrane protease [Streptomyces]|uniref:PrsW family glutamic-type intramembrane protease n=2 Tax=Streptomyces TaxID=1883 RepID=UPI0002000405|nr:PrsW family intramembrane metalloprotease [Streptomyces sp. SID4926]SCE24639.1 Membrane proteinase PrsW, cleaves anti-sigma factor RsiW, M82 family [Streptomyces sp. DfronAA-171]